jgi:HAD superfamily hydrolase (TIGR01509 family)
MTKDYHHKHLETGPDGILQSVDWTEVDHVLLDMDGTLLDLSFDNRFWGSAIFEHYGELNGVSKEASIEKYAPLFKKVEGTLAWYSTDFWSQQFGFDIIEYSNAHAEGIQWLPFAKEFLNTLRGSNIPASIVTNAHPDIVKLKQKAVGVVDLVDAAVSSHTIGHAKESPDFWHQLQSELGFDSERTLFFDDSPAVIQAALGCGLNASITMCLPDSTRPRRQTASQLWINDFEQLTKNLAPQVPQ